MWGCATVSRSSGRSCRPGARPRSSAIWSSPGFRARDRVVRVAARGAANADTAELFALVGDLNSRASLRALVPNVRGAERAVAAQAGEIVAFLSSSEAHNRTNLNQSLAQGLERLGEVVAIARSHGLPVHGGIATSFGCPYEGDVPPAAVLAVVRRMVDLGIRSVTLGDTTGMATPEIVRKVCTVLRDAVPDLRLTLHFHNTRGLALVNVAAALQLGIRSFEGAIGGLGGCPFAPTASGNLCTEDLVNFLHEEGYETGINLARLIAISRRMEAWTGRTLPGQVMHAGSRLTLHDPAAASVAHG